MVKHSPRSMNREGQTTVHTDRPMGDADSRTTTRTDRFLTLSTWVDQTIQRTPVQTGEGQEQLLKRCMTGRHNRPTVGLLGLCTDPLHGLLSLGSRSRVSRDPGDLPFTDHPD